MKIVVNMAERLLKVPQSMLGNMRLTEKLLNRRGLEFIDLDPVKPSGPTCQKFIDEISDHCTTDHIAASPAEIYNLKEQLGKMYSKIYGYKLNPQKTIALTPGCGLNSILICLALVNPGDSVAVPDPGLNKYRIASLMAGATVNSYPLHEKNDYLPNLSALLEPPAKKLKLVFLNYPHNPTSAEADLYFYREIMKMLKYDNVLVILDSPFCGLSDPAIELPLKAKKALNLFIELHSFSYPYGLEGLGFAIGHAGTINTLEQINNICGFQVSSNQVQYAIAALRHHDAIRDNYISDISDKRKLLSDGLKKIGWTVRSGRSAPFIWAKVPPWATSVGFARKMFNRTGVRTRPGSDFGEYGEGYLRLSLTCSKEKIKLALENISDKRSMLRKKSK